MIVLFFLTYLALIGVFLPKDNGGIGSVIRVAILKASVVFSLYFYFTTEILSAFQALRFQTALVLWMILSLITVYIAWRKSPRFLSIIFYRIRLFFQQKEYLLYGILAFCIPLLFIALFVPSTHPDVLTHHAVRVMHWIYQGDVDYFPTMNGRQLYEGPFAEYVVLQLQLVTQKIWYSNLPQFFSMLCTCMVISLISEKFYNNRHARNISVLLMFILPIGLFESTNALNDHVATFFTIASIYFLIEIYTEKKWINVFFFSVAFALTGLTKFTGWIFVFPFYLYFGLLLIKKYRLQAFKILPIIIGVSMIVLGPFFLRNLNTFHHLWGAQQGEELYSDLLNEDVYPSTIFFNTVKNAGSAAATPICQVNQFIENLAFEILSFGSSDWDVSSFVNFSFHEDRASNFIHFWLFLLSFVLLWFVKYKKSSWIYFAFLWASWVLFSAVYKWQPGNSRMEIIWFALAIPFLGYLYTDVIKTIWVRFVLFGGACFYSLFVVILNPSKQLIPMTDLSEKMPSFFSEQDLKILEKDSLLLEKVLANIQALNEYGLNFYLLNESHDFTKEEQNEIINILDFPRNGSIYQKSYVERMMPLDMTVYHQVKNMLRFVDTPESRIGLSLLPATREFLILYPLSKHPNVASIKNVAYPSILSTVSNTQEVYEYDYLLTNNFQIFDQLDMRTVDEVYDFAYFKLYKFRQPQHRKYEVKDILQNFSL